MLYHDKWVNIYFPDAAGATRSNLNDIQSLQKQNTRLNEENNLLKIKMAFIIDTVSLLNI